VILVFVCFASDNTVTAHKLSTIDQLLEL